MSDSVLEAIAVEVDETWRAKGGINCTEVCAIIRSHKMKYQATKHEFRSDPLQLSDLEFEQGKLVKIRGMRINYMQGDYLLRYLGEIAQLAKRQRAPWGHRMFFPIIMPIDKYGRGPVSGKEIAEITWEVWDQLCNSYSSHTSLGEAVLKAEELNDKFGHCVDEGCPHYGTPHTHFKPYGETYPFKAQSTEHPNSNAGRKTD